MSIIFVSTVVINILNIYKNETKRIQERIDIWKGSELEHQMIDQQTYNLTIDLGGLRLEFVNQFQDTRVCIRDSKRQTLAFGEFGLVRVTNCDFFSRKFLFQKFLNCLRVSRPWLQLPARWPIFGTFAGTFAMSTLNMRLKMSCCSPELGTSSTLISSTSSSFTCLFAPAFGVPFSWGSTWVISLILCKIYKPIVPFWSLPPFFLFFGLNSCFFITSLSSCVWCFSYSSLAGYSFAISASNIGSCRRDLLETSLLGFILHKLIEIAQA